MALPIIAAQIGYGLIRSLLARYGSRKGVQTLMQQLKVDKKTAQNILGTYKRVKNKGVKGADGEIKKTGGDVTLKIAGKQVTSNKNVINFETTKDQALILKNNPLSKAGGTGGKGNLLGGNSLNPTAGSKMFPQGTGQGLFSTVKEGVRTGANATGRGLLSTAKFAGSGAGLAVGGGGLLAYNAMNPERDAAGKPIYTDPQAGLNKPGKDAYYDQNGQLVMNDGSVKTSSYRDDFISGKKELPITKKSYENFKQRLLEYRRKTGTEDFDFGDGIVNIGIGSYDSDDPRSMTPTAEELKENPNLIDFSQEAALYKKESQERINKLRNFKREDEYVIGLDGKKQLVPSSGGKSGTFQMSYDAMIDAEKQATTPNKPAFSLSDAKDAFATASSLSDKEPQNKYGERFTRIEGEDRNALERTFGFGEQGVYQENMYDKKTGRYVPNPKGRIFTEDEIVNNSKTVTDYESTSPNSLNIADDPNSNPDNIAFNAKGIGIGPVVPPTETIQTDRSRSTTMGANGETINAGNRVGNNAAATGDFANQMGLANFLYNQSKQGQGQFLGANSGFNTGFLNNQNPQQQMYGQRPAGLFDPEYYKQIMSFLN